MGRSGHVNASVWLFYLEVGLDLLGVGQPDLDFEAHVPMVLYSNSARK